MDFVRLMRAPLDDYLAGLSVLLPHGTWRTLVLVLLAAAVSWWIYVPVHELAHAFGCLASGGEVTRLEIDAVYGAAWLRQIFPFVAVGSDYAGQLTGFDTHGSDWIYLATDVAPFVLTILIGVPLLRYAATIKGWRCALAFGSAIPLAFAPFISVPGDFYEMGSIIVSRVAFWFGGPPVERWRSDDVFQLAGQLVSQGGTWSDWLAIALALALGLVLAIAVYAAGSGWAAVLGIERLSASDTWAGKSRR